MLISAMIRKEIDRIVEVARKHILTSKFPGSIAGYNVQETFLRRIEDAAIAWADTDEPNVNKTILIELHLLQAFRAMLRTLDTGGKEKPNARRNLARHRRGARTRTS